MLNGNGKEIKMSKKFLKICRDYIIYNPLRNITSVGFLFMIIAFIINSPGGFNIQIVLFSVGAFLIFNVILHGVIHANEGTRIKDDNGEITIKKKERGNW